MKKPKRLLAFLIACLFAVTFFGSTAMQAFAEDTNPESLPSIPAATDGSPSDSPAQDSTSSVPEETPAPETPDSPSGNSGTPGDAIQPDAVNPDAPTPASPYAVYYRVRFFNWDGTQIGSDQSIEQGLAAVEPQEPGREGYRFLGWEPNVQDATTSEILQDTDFTATFEELLSYTITINYIFADTSTASPSLTDSATRGMAFNKTYPSPEIEGYTPNLTSQVVNIPYVDQDYTYTIIYTPKGDTPYVVEHYLQKPNTDPQDYANSYVLQAADTEHLTGQTDSQALATPNPYPGFSPPDTLPTALIAGSGETVLKVYYTRNQYAVYFNTGDGGSYIPPIPAYYGDSVTLPPNPTRTGYTFAGWNPATSSPITMPANDIVLNAKWTANNNIKYTLVYWLEKTTSTSASPAYDYVGTSQPTGTAGGTPVIPATVPVTMPIASAYYTYNSSKTQAEMSGVTIKGDGSTVVNVYYTRNEYTITFKFGTKYKLTVNGVDYNNSYSFTAKVGAPLGTLWPGSPVPKNGQYTEGYFVGWEGNNTTYVTRQYVLDTSIISDTSSNGATAIWDDGTKLVTVHYRLPNLDGSIDTSKDQQVTTASNTTSWNAKTFQGFTISGSSNQPIDSNNSVTFTYTRNSYSLTYYNGNVVHQTLTVPYETSLNLPLYAITLTAAQRPSYLPDQYEFGGWYTTPSGIAGTQFDFTTGKMPAANLILYAKWVPKTYTVTFNPNNGSSTFTQNVVYLSTASQPPAPVKPGFTFVGWFKNSTDTLKYVFNFPVSESFVLTARYVANNNISYDVVHKLSNGTIYLQQTYGGKRVGDSVTAKAISIPGYLPDKLSDTLSLVATGNIITFTYSPQVNIQYTVRYLYEDTGQPCHAPKTGYSTANSITENFEPVPGYYPNYYQQTLQLTNNEAQNIITFLYKPNPLATYTVITYWEKLDGSYATTSELKQKAAGSYTDEQPAATVVAGTINYEYKSAISSPNKVVASNGSTVVRIYYDRARYTVTFTLDLLAGVPRGTLVGQTTFTNIRSGAPFNTIGTAPQIVPDYGYQFSGWSPAYTDTDAVTQNKTYTATPSIDPAKWGTITYYPNDAPGSPVVSNPILFGTELNLSGTLYTYTTYDFAGWNTKSDGSGTAYGAGQRITFSGNLELYAQWVPEDYYMVKYLPNGGTGTMVDNTHYYINPLDGPNKATLMVNGFSYPGYTFKGWDTRQSPGGSPQYTEGFLYTFEPGCKDLILYAQWERDDSQWATVQYNKNSLDATGTMPDEPNLLVGKSHNLLANTFTRLHYTFIGWSTDPGYNPELPPEYANGGAITPLNNATIVLYAIWKEDNKYKIVYHSNPPNEAVVEEGATDITLESEMGYNGDTLDVTTQPTFQFDNLHYRFVRWNTKPDGTGDPYIPGTDVTFLDENVELYAIWEKDQLITITYKDGYSAFAGVSHPYYLASGEYEDITVWGNDGISAFARNGYHFLFWDADWVQGSDNYSAFAYGNTAIPHVNYSITFTAQWAPNEYQIAYNLNGGAVEGSNPSHYNIETSSFSLINPVKPGYTFLGWSGSGINGVRPNVTVALGSTGERSYTAMWEKDPNQWSHITFVNSNPAHGTIAGTLSYEGIKGQPTSGQQVNLPAVTPKAGYEFDYWSAGVPANFPEQDAVIIVYWKATQTSSPGSSGTDGSSTSSSSSSTSRSGRQGGSSSSSTSSSSVVSESSVDSSSQVTSSAAVTPSSSGGGQSSSGQQVSEAASSSEPQLSLFGGMFAPLGGPNKHNWALVNLLIAIVTTILSVILLVRMFRKKEEDEPKKQNNLFRILAIITGLLAPIIFFFTENIFRQMILVDEWTMLMVVVLAVQLVFILLLRTVKHSTDNARQQ